MIMEKIILTCISLDIQGKFFFPFSRSKVQRNWVVIRHSDVPDRGKGYYYVKGTKNYLENTVIK